MDVANPFSFQFIHNIRSVNDIDDLREAVVLASPGFLNSGPSRQLFDRSVSSGIALEADPFYGFRVQPKHIMQEPE
jgi:hypothetical protein